MKQLADKFILVLINRNIIKEEDKEIYSYGFNQILFIMLNFITILIIGILFNMLFETIIFIITIYTHKNICWWLSCKNTN